MIVSDNLTGGHQAGGDVRNVPLQPDKPIRARGDLVQNAVAVGGLDDRWPSRRQMTAWARFSRRVRVLRSRTAGLFEYAHTAPRDPGCSSGSQTSSARLAVSFSPRAVAVDLLGGDGVDDPGPSHGAHRGLGSISNDVATPVEVQGQITGALTARADDEPQPGPIQRGQVVCRQHPSVSIICPSSKASPRHRKCDSRSTGTFVVREPTMNQVSFVQGFEMGSG